MNEFFAMGGYAFFVWLSYGVVAFVLIANVWSIRVQRKRVRRSIVELYEQNETE